MKFDFKSPDYVAEFRRRADALVRIREEPGLLPALKLYYRDHIADFITDWGCTVDPRNIERQLPALIPFVLYDRQREWIDEVIYCWKNQLPLIVDKSRDMGVTWLAISASCSLCLFNPGMAVGFGSRKEEYVDKIGAPKSIFHKGRMFMQHLPAEFRGGWTLDDAPHLRINFPNGSNISGESGDNIGRGDRTGIYFVDESAYVEHPDLIEASLSQTTNCRIDISSPNGMANPFAQKRFGGKIRVFTFHWTDDPRKSKAWYEKQKEELDPVVLAQEVDIDYTASVEGVVIPNKWVRAAVDAHEKLGFKITGARSGSLDIADEGKDKNAFCGGHGILVEFVEEWSGKGSDTFYTIERAFELCDENDYRLFKYDADGLGATARGDARVINERRKLSKQREIEVVAFRGSEGVFEPEKEDVKGRKNQDYFMNRKAQAWWSLRKRFQNTYRAIEEGKPWSADEIISLSSKMKNLQKLITELSQPTYHTSTIGKIVIDKAPDGAPSPNCADSVMMQFSNVTRAPLVVPQTVLKRFATMPSRRHRSR